MLYNRRTSTLRHNHSPAEHNPTDSNSFHELSSVITETIETLHGKAEPSKTTTEIISLPFGQLKEGCLSTRITTIGSVATARYMRYGSLDRRENFLLTIGNRRITRNTPRGQMEISPRALARRLDRAWPLDKDNSSIRSLVDQNEISLDDLAGIIVHELAPTAPHQRTDETFTYNNPSVTNLGHRLGDPSKLVDENIIIIDGKMYRLNDGISVDITGVYSDSLLHRADASLVVPCEYNGLAANIINKMRVNGIGDVVAKSHLHDSDGNRREIPIMQKEKFTDEVSEVLNTLTKERLSLS